tara:strand:- start:1008 stop:1664 length:657 start_codon:yes stop_codon:yes gene_type:complete
MSGGYTPPPVTGDLKVWSQNIVTYLQRTASRLSFKRADARASENGIILWDEVNEYPVVSKNGEWRQIVLEDGHYDGVVSTDQTAATINTAYTLTFTPILAAGIANGTPASRLVISEGGQFFVSFNAQIASSSGSTLTFWFWFRINGVDVAHSSMENSLHQNNATFVTSRSTILQLAAGDYLEMMWAVDSTSGTLEAHPATAFAPTNPAATVSIVRLHG